MIPARTVLEVLQYWIREPRNSQQGMHRIICDAISAMDNGELDESQIKIFPTGEIRIPSTGVKEGNAEKYNTGKKDTDITG